MASEEDVFSVLGKPEEGEELLSLLIEVGGTLTVDAAARSLGKEPELVRSWANALERDGWINPLDKDLTDPKLKLSESSWKRLADFDRVITERDQLKQIAADKQAKAGARASARESAKSKFDKVLILDSLIIASIILCLELLRRFIFLRGRDSAQVFSAMLLFTVAAMTFRGYDKVSKSKSVFVNALIVLRVARSMLARRKRYVTLFFMIMTLVFFAGNFATSRNPFFLVVAVVPLTTIILVYDHNPSPAFSARFHAGMMLLTYAVLLILGFATLSKNFFGGTVRVVDAALGVAIIAVLKLKDDVFHVSPEYLKLLISERPPVKWNLSEPEQPRA